ncbi:MAG TPA: VWA domain-containing protein [Blastocatellia bacterium]|nr:VWA domain-containing protein [Blastocatellia bacterium]
MKKEQGKTYRMVRTSLRVVLALSFLLIPFSLLAQSGRKPSSAQETRPRRAEPPPVEDQDDKPITLSADLVTAITSVTDQAGNQVNDLTAKEFEIYEDNVLQDIAGLYREDDLPLRMVFLFDSSSSIRHRLDFEKRAAAQFFRQLMRPNDQAALISVSTDPRVEVPFTSDVERLVAGLDLLKAEGATSLYNALIEAAKYVRPTEGRHIMVVLSDGTDTASATTLAQALTEVQKSDAVIYSVHSTGVAPSANVQDLAGEFVLKAMSEDTGGRAFFPPIQEDPKKEVRDLDEIYRRIAAEVRAQYVLTYYSKNAERSDSFRSIRVEVKRPGLQVRTRRGYYTAKKQ